MELQEETSIENSKPTMSAPSVAPPSTKGEEIQKKKDDSNNNDKSKPTSSISNSTSAQEEKKEDKVAVKEETSAAPSTDPNLAADPKEDEAANEGVEVVLGDERGSSKVVGEDHIPRRTTQTSRVAATPQQPPAPSHPPRPTPDQNVFRHPQAVRPRAMRAPPQGHPHAPPPHPYVHASGSWGGGSYGPPPPPPPHSYHHGPPPMPPHGEYPPTRPYPVPPYASSGSFDDQASYYQTPHYSPHVQYPHPGSSGGARGGYSEDVNVISPNHKSDPPVSTGSSTSASATPAYPQRGPAPRPRHHAAPYPPPPPPPPHSSSYPPPAPHHYYQYPPASPVSRQGGGSGTTSASPAAPPPRGRSYGAPPPPTSSSSSAPRHRPDGPYSKAQRETHHYPPHSAHYANYPRYYASEEGGSWGAAGGYPIERKPSGEPVSSSSAPRSSRSSSSQQPPLVTETSFDSEHLSHRSQPTTPSVATATTTPPHPPSSGGGAVGPGPGGSDPHYQFYQGNSWGSFDSSGPPPPLHFDDYPYHHHHRYYHGAPHHPHMPPPPPESPYSPYMAPPYSPPGAGPSSMYRAESFPPPPQYGPNGSFSYSYDDTEERFLKDYHPDRDGVMGTSEGHHMNKNHVTPPGHHHGSKSKSRLSKSGTGASSNTSNNSMLLPKAAEEVDFDVTDPPAEPVTPPSDEPVCESLADVNAYDVLCGRGGGTNSQIGNRRFRKLVQEFQPTYLLARRKEKPLLARTIVLIIRKRGGRFLRKDEDTGELFEVGDSKAEAKTSQALREGLDVRATKSAASSLLEKKKKKKASGSSVSKGEHGSEQGDEDDDDDMASPTPSVKSRGSTASHVTPKDKTDRDSTPRMSATGMAVTTPSRHAESPPTLPRLGEEEPVKSGMVHPHSPSPESMHYRKRRRMRTSGGGSSNGAPPPAADRFFPDFCPPRADLARPASPDEHPYHHHPRGHQLYPHHAQQLQQQASNIAAAAASGACCSPMQLSSTSIRRTNTDDGIHYENESVPAQGCTGIALDMVTGAATSSFCLGPIPWRR